ncbi:MAG TPA: AMP-binding protein [Ideonella sp.]|uniref:AMP-binding protein n=1 Tax=Ideonella sp. TaxID=1929293 RepID=UPI002B60FEA0|nr:AMP-binding protein [Ideonella sp.]HSI50392.1 AMP-binding protein [Ideonella sp.]
MNHIDWTALLAQPQINLADCLVQRHVREGRGVRPALLFHDTRLSYDALQQAMARSAHLLQRRGVLPGDRVLLVVPDSPAFVSSFYAILALGAVAVLANPLLPPADLVYMAQHAGARFAVMHQGIGAKAQAVGEAGVQVLQCGDGAGERGELERAAAGEPSVFPIAETAADALAYVLFSSGTTGKPKAIPRRHRDILHCTRAFGDDILAMDENDLVVAVPKLTFGYALGGSLLFAGVAGAAAVVFPLRSTAAMVAEQIERHRPSVFLATPRILAELLKSPGAEALLDTVRIATSAGEPLPPSVLQAWRARLAAPLIDGFGSTEVGHIFLSNSVDDIREDSCGRCLSEFRVKLIGDDGQSVNEGASGRMCIAGPSVASGYLNDPERSAASFDGEWHISSDLFTCRDGAYTYVGRADDMVKKGCGEWVSPYEVEDALMKLDAVLEVAVVGSRTPAGVIGLKAFVVTTPDTPVSEALVATLIEHTRQRWPDFPHKHLDEVEFIAELPRNVAGKVQRQQLRQQSLTEFSYDC